MSLIQVFQSVNGDPIPLGNTVCLDGAGKILPFDALVHSTDDIVGVVCPKELLSGRELITGNDLFKYEYYKFTEFHQYELDANFNYVENENYVPNFDWVADSSYHAVLFIGLGVVSTGQTINPEWRIIDTNHSTSTALYLLH